MKPLVAFVIVVLSRDTLRTRRTVARGLAQIDGYSVNTVRMKSAAVKGVAGAFDVTRAPAD